jgi:hypothetical protein
MSLQSGEPRFAQPAGHDARRAQAVRRVAAMKGFYIHLFVFAVVLLGLLLVDAADGGRWWVHWVFLGWGIGILAHALAVFGPASRAVAEWERRKLEQLMKEP